MPRLQNPYTQYLDENGDPYEGANLYIYESNTNVLKSIYSDDEETTPISNPVTLGTRGEVQNVFYTGSARLRLVDINNNQVFDLDPVGGESQLGNFSVWGSPFIYSVNNLVRAADGNFYRSLSNANQGNDPTVSPGTSQYWEQVNFLGLYNTTITYISGNVVQTLDGQLWRGVSAANLNNNPLTDNGANWLPVYRLTNDDLYSQHLQLSGGGSLVVSRVNEVADSSTYNLPAAATVPDGYWIDIYLPERYRIQTPVIARNGSDNIVDSNGADSTIEFDLNSWGMIRLVSDGVNNWSI